jgi:translation elongation factor EF-4
VNSTIIAREDLKAYRKDVTSKCYGGDLTRKMKLIKRQSDGKKKLRSIGKIEVEKDTFIKILKRK